MFRFLTLALLAGAAIPAAAVAQDNERGDRGRFRAERATAAGDVYTRAQRPERPARVVQPAPASAPAAVQTQPDRGSWRGNRGDGGQRGGWRGERGDGGQRGWRGTPPTTPPATVPQPQPVPQARDRGMAGALGLDRDRGERRDWNRGDGNRRDWDRGRSGDRRDWNRNDNRRDWNRNQGRRDWNDRRWNDGRGWNQGWDNRGWDNRGWDGDRRWDGNRGNRGGWDRGWRNDRRYDWQRYRTTNRFAYRWPQYFAPRGWTYGYRQFDIGSTLFAGLFAQNYWIGNPYDYRLPPVEWPFQWVRYYDDALLVDTETGQVADVIPGIFW